MPHQAPTPKTGIAVFTFESHPSEPSSTQTTTPLDPTQTLFLFLNCAQICEALKFPAGRTILQNQPRTPSPARPNPNPQVSKPHRTISLPSTRNPSPSPGAQK
ncbi:MAG: hypothetical protein LQ349_009477, partial [Xanthoria aureola]